MLLKDREFNSNKKKEGKISGKHEGLFLYMTFNMNLTGGQKSSPQRNALRSVGGDPHTVRPSGLSLQAFWRVEPSFHLEGPLEEVF